MTKTQKAIRSSGWQTDLMIGFPDGVLLLLFTTQILYSKNLTVQAFYTLHLIILGVATLLMMIAVFRANRGEEDEGVMTPEEAAKLRNLDLSAPTIAHIADEMQKDQAQWEATLQTEEVPLRDFGLRHAIRSTLLTGGFFLLGGLIAFVPFLMQEDFSVAGRTSLVISILALVAFGWVKSRITGQRLVGLTMRYLLTGSVVVLASYLISSVI
ncbi:VIT1/CCC1 transporter family protein [Chitinophaga sp.]|uniref:VIT1/CCC1 transporter family protein n=1 Tax=Chitinophaga sp. TaxID=1869181 RepID=UPI002602FB62|nr:VIT1/CCC1 transporter family protein [uncultured Chitinophaga sp.]